MNIFQLGFVSHHHCMFSGFSATTIHGVDFWAPKVESLNKIGPLSAGFFICYVNLRINANSVASIMLFVSNL